ncbi:MAG: HAD family hydrolase [Micromonosporaceae bacterium]
MSQWEPTLVLWDIDRTLISVGGVSRELYQRAFQQVTGQPLRELAEFAGRTERAILTQTCAMHGIPENEIPFSDFYRALAEAAHHLRDEMARRGRVLPGVEDAVKALLVEPVVQSVVTGNIPPIAITKLEAVGLPPGIDLEIGGYGSDDGERAPLIRAVRRRATQKYQVAYEPRRVVVIGDTPRDIEGAHQAGVRCVAVATGVYTLEELSRHQPAAVFPDLTDTTALIRILQDSQSDDAFEVR